MIWITGCSDHQGEMLYRYSEGLQDLVSSMLVVEAMERPSISWVMDRVDNLLHDLDNRV